MARRITARAAVTFVSSLASLGIARRHAPTPTLPPRIAGAIASFETPAQHDAPPTTHLRSSRFSLAIRLIGLGLIILTLLVAGSRCGTCGTVPRKNTAGM
jgi:hypothetical protein